MWRSRELPSVAARGRWQTRSIDQLPAAPGTYAIFRSDPTPPAGELGSPRLVYIGSANNVRGRLQDFGLAKRWPRRVSHFGQVDRLLVKVAIDRTPLQHLTREARLITRLKPPLNRTTWRTHK